MSNDNIESMLDKIDLSAKELDVVIREVGKKLTDETGIDPFKDYPSKDGTKMENTSE